MTYTARVNLEPTPSEFSSFASKVSVEPYKLRCANYSASDRHDPKIQGEVAAAIASLSEGRPVCFGKYPEGVYRRMMPLQNSADLGKSRGPERGIIALAVRYEGEGEAPFLKIPTFTLVYFPQPKHVPHYFQAGEHSYRAGPSDLYPGSIGVLQLVYDFESSCAQVVQLQSSVKLSVPSVAELLKEPGNSLCTRYQKWSSRLLDEGFGFVRRLGIRNISVGDLAESNFPLTTAVRNHQMITKKATASGFVLTPDKRMLVDKRADG